MLNFNSVQELVEKSAERNIKISQLIMEAQADEIGISHDEMYKKMLKNLQVMRKSIKNGLDKDIRSASGLSGGNAYKIQQYIEQGRSIGGNLFTRMLRNVMSVAELNACMGEIVAAPTAGSCGIIPGVLITIAEEKDIAEEDLVMGLFTSAGIGLVIAKEASISGAEGGCQAECGSASAMAASALVEMLGGDQEQVANACAIALKNILGLVCDPVAGFVEIPCIKRNIMGASNALAAAELALAGIRSVIPVDEVIGAMKAVGDSMPVSLKETAEGGLATTPTGIKIKENLVAK